MSNTAKILIGVLVLVVIGVAGYFYFSGSGSTDTALAPEGQVVGQDILVLAEKLQQLSIDSSVFTSATFLSLSDRQALLSPEPEGRINPFSKIGNEAPGNIPPQPTKTNTTGESPTP